LEEIDDPIKHFEINWPLVIENTVKYSESSEQVLVTECFLTCFWKFLISNELEQLEFKLEKKFRNMQEKLEKDVIAFFLFSIYTMLWLGQSVISQLEYDKLWLIQLKFGLRTLKLFVLVANFAVQTNKGSTLLFHLRIVCCLCNLHFIFNTIIKAASNYEGQKKFGVPEKKAVFFLIKGLLFSRVPQIFLALLILKRL